MLIDFALCAGEPAMMAVPKIPGYELLSCLGDVIAGGTARNIVARDCMFQWEFRGLPGVASSGRSERLDAFARELSEREFKNHPGTGVETATETDVPGLAQA